MVQIIVRNCRNMFHHYFLILSISLCYFVILNDISKISIERKWAVVCSTTPLHRDETFLISILPQINANGPHSCQFVKNEKDVNVTNLF